jgi:methyl-accepting chemotaxis protein
VKHVEDLLKKILLGQEKMDKKLNNMGEDVQSLVEDVQSIKKVVNRIENHQEDTIMGMLTHIHK